MKRSKSIYLKVLILVGIMGFIGLSGQCDTESDRSDQFQSIPSTAAVNQTNTIPASGGYLYQNIPANITAAIRDEASLGRAYEGGNLVINKSGSLYANDSLLPAGSFDDCYDSFVDDVIGGIPNGYIPYQGTGGSLAVAAGYLGHSNVLKVTATVNTAEFTGIQWSAAGTSGNFSCWICVDKEYPEAYQYCPIFGSSITNLAIMNGYFRYWRGTGGWQDTGVGAGVNYWYYIRVSFTPSELKWYMNEALIATISPYSGSGATFFQLGVTPNLGTPYSIYYDAIDVDYDSTYDLRNSKDLSMIGFYNGTESFENDKMFSAPSGMQDLSGASCGVQVVPRTAYSSGGPHNVLLMWDDLLANTACVNKTIAPLNSGWVEFWAMSWDTTKQTEYALKGAAWSQQSVDIYFRDGTLNAWDPSYGKIVLCTATNYAWYHIRVYQDVSTKKYDAYVNGIFCGSGINFTTPTWTGSADCFAMWTSTSFTSYVSCLDGLDVSSTPGYYANRSTYNLLQKDVTFSELGSYAFQYTLNASGVNYLGEWSSFAVENPMASAPQSLIAINATNRVDLVWSPPAWTGYGPITNYTVYRGTASGTETLFVTLGDVTSYSDTSATSRTTPYFYKVSANNSYGEGNLSDEVFGDPILMPSEPGNFLATAGNRSINLTWTAPTETGGSWITNYTLYRRTYLESVCTFLIAFDNTTFTYNDTGLTNGDACYYQISANNSAGEGSKTTEVSEVPRTIPGAIATLQVTSTGIGWVYLTWQSPASTGGSPITEYRVYRGTVKGEELLAANVGTLNYYNDTGRTNGVKYWYYVTATNIVGEGNGSNECWGIPTYKLIVQPTAGLTGIQLSWNQLSYISSYVIYRYSARIEDYTLSSPIGTTSKDNYFDALNVGENLFYYQVLGYNAEGDLVVVSQPVSIYYTPPASINPIVYLVPGIAVVVVVVAYLVHRSRHSMPKLSRRGL